MLWSLILEEYGPEMHYIPGPGKIVADDMRRITMIDANVQVNNCMHTISLLQEVHLCVHATSEECPLYVALVAHYQITKLAHATTSTKILVESTQLFTYITTAILGDASLRGSSEAFILRWQDYIRKM